VLRRRGMRVTSPRLVIHRLVLERDRHVTAEEVRDAVAASLPGVSLPTVYATLELLEELGIVRRVEAGRSAVRAAALLRGYVFAARRPRGRRAVGRARRNAG
jgi:Fe2+ or Zn2+ uptake regulation protein